MTQEHQTAIEGINEFGETSFSFVAPDGYFWTLLEGNCFNP